MSQDSNTESDSSAKKKLTLRRKGAPRNDAPPAASGSDLTSPTRMKFSPKGKSEEAPAKPSPPPEEPLVPQKPLASRSPSDTPTIKPKLKSSPSDTPKPPSEKKSDSANVPLSFTPPPSASSPESSSPPAAPKVPPGVKIVKDEPAAPAGPPPVLPPVISQTAGSHTPPPLSAPALLQDDDPDVRPVQTKARSNVLSVVLIFVLILAALGGIGYALFSFLGNSDSETSASQWTPKSFDEEGTGTPPKLDRPEAEAETPAPETDPLTPESPEATDWRPDTFEPIPTSPTLVDTDGEAGQANPDVAAWIEQMRPNALMGNRMSIDGTTYRIGDKISTSPLVIWVGHDPDLAVLTFRDANGVLYEKDY